MRDIDAGWRLAPTPALAFAAVAAACSSTSSSVADTAVRDSAGVEIVESRAPAWTPDQAWSVSAEPAVVIGRPGSGEDLFGVRGATRLADGRVVVANHGTSELRIYDSSGDFLGAAGGPGEGPGEFISIGELWHLADSLYVFDYTSLRLSVLSSDGGFGRLVSFAPGRDGRLSLPVGLFSDGTILASHGRADLGQSPGLVRDTMTYSLRDEAAVVRGTVARLPGAEYYTGTMEGRTLIEPRPFGLRPSGAVGGDLMFYGSGEAYGVAAYRKNGTLVRVVRLLRPREPVGPADRAALEDRAELESREGNPWVRAVARQMELPDLKPAHGVLRVDASGNLWVARYAPDETQQHLWDVFDVSGQWLGDVETPVGGRIWEIGEDYLLGTWRDELDVEEVRLYRILKPKE